MKNSNLEKLKQDKRDNVLADFIEARGACALINGATFNRGDFFEMAITGEKVKRDGLHGISKGDYVMPNGLVVEVKYLTKKTGASKDLQGTLASHYLLGFNTGKEIELHLVPVAELVAVGEGKHKKITYQNNYALGVRIKL